MKKIIKLISMVSMISLLFTIVAGCQSSKPDTQTSQQATQAATVQSTQQETAKSKENITLRFSWWGGEDRHKATIEAINKYMELNPNVKISPEYSGFDGYYEKLATQIAGNTAPDVEQVNYLNVADLHSDTVFEDLNKHTDIIDLSAFDPNLLKGYTEFNGVLMGLPTGINGQVIAYNKTLLDKNGLSIPDGWDWNDFVTIGTELHKKDSNAVFFLSDTDGLQSLIHSFLMQRTGTQFINADYTLAIKKEDALAMFNWIKAMVDNNVVVPFQEWAPYEGKSEQYPKWASGELGAEQTVTSIYPDLAKVCPPPCGISIIPRFKDAKISGESAKPANIFSVNKNSPNKDEGVKLVNWLLNDKDAVLILGTVRSIPASSAARKILTDANKIDPKIADAVAQILKNTCNPEPQIALNDEINKTILIDLVQKVGFKKITPEQAADELMTKLDAKLKELKQK